MAHIIYLHTEGPVNPDTTLIRYDVPFAPDDPKKSMKLRQKMGLSPDVPAVDPNVRAVLDSFIQPREWIDAAGVRWVQHASAEPAARIDVVRTREKLEEMMATQGGRPTGVCPVRTFLHSECFVEVIRQTVVESWERGLLMLKLRGERVQAQKAHRELFESRTGYAFRLALKGDKDTSKMIEEIEMLKAKIADLIAKEDELKTQCEEFQVTSEKELLIDEKHYQDELRHLKVEANSRRTMLENLTAPSKKT